MLVPMEWLNDYIDPGVSTDEFCERMIMSGSNLETCEEMGTGMERVVVGRIEKIEPHPDADKLVICQMDVGDEELLQIVDALRRRLHRAPAGGPAQAEDPDDTRVIYITITYPDPYKAADIANEVREAAVSRIQEVVDIKSVKVVSPANVPDKKSSPSNTKNALIGALAGALLAIIIIMVRFLMNDTIRDAADVEKYLHVSTLGTVPLAAGTKKSGRRPRPVPRGVRQEHSPCRRGHAQVGRAPEY